MSPLFRRSAPATTDESRRIQNFWKWWAANRKRLAEAIPARTVVQHADDISSAVKSIDAGLAWELGAGLTAAHQFVVSGEGDIVKRALAGRVIASAPPPDEIWEYHPARQANPPTANYSITIAGVSVNAADVRYATTIDQNRERLNVAVWHAAFPAIAESDRMQIAFLMLDGTLGEDEVERWLGSIEVVTEAPLGATDRSGLLATRDALQASATGDRFQLAQATGPDGKPRVVFINTALKQIDHLDKPARFVVTISLQQPDANGFPAGGENEALGVVEDAIEATLPGAVFAGRVTGAGLRVLTWYVANADAATAKAEAVIAGQPWQVDIRTVDDPRWEALKRNLLT